mgnify:CR=1 FL=1
MKRILKALPFDLTYLTILGLGLFGNVTWAKNIGLFISWFLGIALLLVVFVTPEALKKRAPRPKIFVVWDVLTDLAPVGMFAAKEYFVIAALLGVGFVCKHNIYLRVEESLKKEVIHEKQKAGS